SSMSSETAPSMFVRLALGSTSPFRWQTISIWPFSPGVAVVLDMDVRCRRARMRAILAHAWHPSACDATIFDFVVAIAFGSSVRAQRAVWVGMRLRSVRFDDRQALPTTGCTRSMNQLEESLLDAPIIEKEGYQYF